MKFIPIFFYILVLTACDLIHTSVNISPNSIKYIYDGDTITIKCLKEFKCENDSLKIRIMGVDTPEIKAECRSEIILARKAKQYTVNFVRMTSDIVLTYDKSNKYDRYGRLLAYISVDGQDLSESLINNNLGRRYNGGKRLSWC